MAGPRSIVRLRRALLALFVLLVAGVAVLYWFGRSGLDRPPKVVTQEGELPDEELTFSGKDFDYSFEEGGRTVFTIHGAGFGRDRDGSVVVDQIQVKINTLQGESYEVEGVQGVYDQETQEALLQSGVRVKGPSGIELETTKLQLTQKGKSILGQEPLTFRYLEKAQGRADRMRVDLDERLFILAGDVRVDNGPDSPGPFRVRAGRLYLNRNQHHARADGDVFVAYLAHRLRAPRVTLWLSEDDETVQFVRATQGVRGRLGFSPQADGVGPVRFAGRNLAAIFSPDGGDLARFELGSNPFEPATVISVTPGEPPRRLGASFINGNLEGGNLTRAEALGGVKLAELAVEPEEEAWDAEAEAAPAAEPLDAGEEEESEEEAAPEALAGRDSVALDELDEKATRLATARRAEAGFGPDGQLIEVTLYERVDFRDPQFHARGDQARFDFSNGVGEFRGKPVAVTSARGNMTAPRLLYTQRTGLLVAQAGVRTELRQESSRDVLGESPLAQGEGPIWVESQEAFFRGSSRSFLFRGKVRAWRGDNLVLADELKGDEDSGQLTATGNVRTVTKQKVATPARAASPGAPQPPIEVTAASMVYSKSAGTIVYRTGVQAVQGQRALACDELTVELDASQQLRALVLVGKVKIDDRETGRSVVGDRARYEPGAKTITVEGERATMRDRDGAEVTGQRIVYEFETGKAQVTAAPKPPSPTPGAAPAAPQPSGTNSMLGRASAGLPRAVPAYAWSGR